jgi:hypothetical protein
MEATISKPLRVIGTIAGIAALTLAIPGVGTALGLSAATAGKVAAIASPPTNPAHLGFQKLENEIGEGITHGRDGFGGGGDHLGHTGCGGRVGPLSGDHWHDSGHCIGPAQPCPPWLSESENR